MNWWLVAGIFVVWVIAGLVHFYRIFGDKFRKDKWYDHILLPPAFVVLLVIVQTIRLVDYLIDLFRKEQ